MTKGKTKLLSSRKFEIIKEIFTKFSKRRKEKLVVSISYLYKIAEVSRSGYYSYFSKNIVEAREIRENKDSEKFKQIETAYKYKNRKKDIRQIKMTLEKQFNIIMNLKTIRRLMKKYGLKCPIRKSNPYRRIMKATQEHRVVENKLNREFKQNIPRKVLLTDIIYLYFDNGKKAYLSTIKDSCTNEIIVYNLSKTLHIEIVLETLKQLSINDEIAIKEDTFIHSDQGVHYTSPIFQDAVKKMNLGQSMSRRANCWDNAPQESFSGHFKDEAYIKECSTYEELENEINKYMEYYNKERGQLNLKKITPIEYRNHLLES